MSLPMGYRWAKASSEERSVLLEFVYLTYQELCPDGFAEGLGWQMIDQYCSEQTPRWWVVLEEELAFNPVAGLWLGNALDPVQGDRFAQIFLLYVRPEHRHQGLGSALMGEAQAWAMARGDRQIGLQVFAHNQTALSLYHKLGYHTHSLLMVKSL
ncbi:GNAT family N-acetyltransferase [Spirulina subsalsa FACHB-351]|uniref:GNAT family N-acetyltransferase n=2 Tax=Spirulina subsalsa TaxID=54311 RepID=A0ABT3L867_9CYAN|nr:GNAT family N-acetyltransferase [Spirulina subsalsa FACHB-351]